MCEYRLGGAGDPRTAHRPVVHAASSLQDFFFSILTPANDEARKIKRWPSSIYLKTRGQTRDGYRTASNEQTTNGQRIDNE